MRQEKDKERGVEKERGIWPDGPTPAPDLWPKRPRLPSGAVQLVLQEHLSCHFFANGSAFRDSWYVNWTTSSCFSFFSIVQKKPFGEISPRETTTDTENGESTLREESSFYSREITPLVQVRLPSAVILPFCRI